MQLVRARCQIFCFYFYEALVFPLKNAFVLLLLSIFSCFTLKLFKLLNMLMQITVIFFHFVRCSWKIFFFFFLCFSTQLNWHLISSDFIFLLYYLLCVISNYYCHFSLHFPLPFRHGQDP